MNVFYESIYDLIDELLSLNHFSVEKMHDFDVFNECVTDRPTDRQTDRQTDRLTNGQSLL